MRGLSPSVVADAALGIADRDGLDAVTIARLAGELGVRPPSLYNHIESRDALLRTVAARALDELAQRMGAAAVGRSGPDAITAVAHAYRAFAREHPGWYAATVRTSDPALREAGQRVVDIVLAALRAWDLSDDDALHTVRVLRAALHGFASLEAVGGFGAPIDVDESFERLVKTLVAGI